LFYFILLLQITFYVRTDSVHGKRVGLNLKVSLCRDHACSWLLTSSITQMCNVPPTKFHRSSL